MPLAAPATEDALVADAAGEAVGVETLEQELRRLPAHSEHVPEAGQRDPPRCFALADERVAGALVRGRRDSEAVAHAHEASLLLEEARERGIVHLDGLEAELRLQRGRRGGSRAQLGGCSRPVELRAAALEAEMRRDRLCPWLDGAGDAGIERVRCVDCALEVGAELVEPFLRPDPRAVRENGRMDERLAAFD